MHCAENAKRELKAGSCQASTNELDVTGAEVDAVPRETVIIVPSTAFAGVAGFVSAMT